MGHHVFGGSCRWGPFKEKYLAEHSEDCHVVTKRQARYMASYYRHRTPSIQMHPGEQHQSTQHRPTFIGLSLYAFLQDLPLNCIESTELPTCSTLPGWDSCRSTAASCLAGPTDAKGTRHG